MKPFLLISALLAVLLFGVEAEAQCATDNDCKGDRICEDGRCVSPQPPQNAPPLGAEPTSDPSPPPLPPAEPSPTAPVTPPPPPPPPVYTAVAPPPSNYPASGSDDMSVERPSIETYQKAHFQIMSMIGIGSFGNSYAKVGDEDSESVSGGTHAYGGTYLAGLFGGPGFHIGPYLRIGAGEGVHLDGESDGALEDIGHFHLGTGLAMQFGGLVGKRVRLGGALDLGLSVTNIYTTDVGANNDQRYVGPEVSTRFEVEIFLFTTRSGFKMSIPISVGPTFLPYAAYRPADSEEDAYEEYDLREWLFQVQPVIMFGLALGK